jgi:hypothetical protein
MREGATPVPVADYDVSSSSGSEVSDLNIGGASASVSVFLVMLYFAFMLLIGGLPAAWLAAERGRGYVTWLLVGVFWGPLAVFVVGLAPIRPSGAFVPLRALRGTRPLECCPLPPLHVGLRAPGSPSGGDGRGGSSSRDRATAMINCRPAAVVWRVSRSSRSPFGAASGERRAAPGAGRRAT